MNKKMMHMLVDILKDTTIYSGLWSLEMFICTIENCQYKINKNGIILYRTVFESTEILNLLVKKSAQRKKIATKLIASVIEDVQNIHQSCEIFLEVRIDNNPAIKLYEKMGFKQISIRKKYYECSQGKFVDARVMRYEVLKSPPRKLS